MAVNKNIKYVIGADGGGTKTALAAVTLDGKLLVRSNADGVNYNFIGFGTEVKNILDGINATHLISEVRSTQAETIEAAAQSCAATIADGGMIFTFGTGHLHMLADYFKKQTGSDGIYPDAELQNSITLSN